MGFGRVEGSEDDWFCADVFEVFFFLGLEICLCEAVCGLELVFASSDVAVVVVCELFHDELFFFQAEDFDGGVCVFEPLALEDLFYWKTLWGVPLEHAFD